MIVVVDVGPRQLARSRLMIKVKRGFTRDSEIVLGGVMVKHELNVYTHICIYICIMYGRWLMFYRSSVPAPWVHVQRGRGDRLKQDFRTRNEK